MKKISIFVVFLLILGVGCFTGCAKEKEKPQDLEVVDSAVIVDSHGSASILVGVKNPNTDYALMYGDFEATLKDIDGNVIKNVKITHNYVLPDETMYFSGHANVSGLLYGSAEFDVSVKDKDWKKFSSDKSIKASDYEISNLNKVVQYGGRNNFTGKVTNHTGVSHTGYNGVVIMKNAGKIVNFVEFMDFDTELEDGQSKVFEASNMGSGNDPTFDSFEAFCYPKIESTRSVDELVKKESE